MSTKRSYGEACRFAYALDVVGERWALLVVRELLLGPKRFTDLRTGLPWQMTELHEPVRILFIIDTTPEIMLSIIEKNPIIQQLVVNDWVQLAVLDPSSPTIQHYRRGRFEPYTPESGDLPIVQSSVDWYRGWRDHLGYASVIAGGPTPDAGSTGASLQEARA